MDSVITAGELLVNGDDAQTHGYINDAEKIILAVEGVVDYSMEDAMGFIARPILDGGRTLISPMKAAKAGMKPLRNASAAASTLINSS